MLPPIGRILHINDRRNVITEVKHFEVSMPLLFPKGYVPLILHRGKEGSKTHPSTPFLLSRLSKEK